MSTTFNEEKFPNFLDNLVMEEAERAAKQSGRELRSILMEKDREIWNVEGVETNFFQGERQRDLI